MKVTEIRYEKLVNLGNYSHAKGSAVMVLEDGDSPIEAFARARHLVQTQINEETETEQYNLPPTAPAGDDDDIPF
jgi:hypothetical protein